MQRSAGASLSLAAGFSVLAGLFFIGMARPLAGAYTNDPQVVQAAIPLFYLSGLLLICDSFFVVFASAMTGLGDTRTPMWVSIVCNWMLGMPLSYVLAFPMGHGLYGLWAGRAVASVTGGAALTACWYWRMRQERNAEQNHGLQLLAPLGARTSTFA